jgi:hypothetical protein
MRAGRDERKLPRFPGQMVSGDKIECVVRSFKVASSIPYVTSGKQQGGSHMRNDHPHLKVLRERHKALEEKISEMGKRPLPDQVEISNLKKQKLHIKEEITSLA